MWYEDSGLMITHIGHIPKEHADTEVPCWSLAALLSVIPNYKLNNEHNYHTCTAETSIKNGH